MTLDQLSQDLWSAAYDLGIPGERFDAISMYLENTPGETREECEDLQFLASIAAGINSIEIAAMRWEYA